MLTEQDFNYCPKCGNQFEKKWSNLLVCARCDFHYYINPKPTNALIAENEKGEILFIKRKFPPKKGLLDLPGGFVDLKETMEESLRRELKEELGLILKDFTYLGSYSDRYNYKNVKFYTLCFVYTTRLPSTTRFEVGNEGPLVWVKKGKVDYDKIAFESLKKALKEYSS